MFAALLVVCQLGAEISTDACGSMIPTPKPFLNENQCIESIQLMNDAGISEALKNEGLYIATAKCIDLFGTRV